MFRRGLAIIMVAMVAGLVGLSSLSPVVAQETANATRSFDSATVAPGGELVVTITAADYGQAGGVTETLPSGFSYESSTLPAYQVLASGQEVRFTVSGPEDSPFRYTVTASSVPGVYAFSGMLRDSDRVDHTVGGESSVTVETATTAPTPAASRGLSASTVAPGGELVVTITAADYGQAGGVTETLPSGFSYESSTLPAYQVLASGQEVRFTVSGPEDSPFRYTVTASSVPGVYAFSGMLRDSDRADHTVGGESSVTVEAATTAPTPAASRALSASTVAPSGELVVTITAADYGQAGGVTETLPSGFSYESSTLPAYQVLASGQEVRFTVSGPEDSPFRYTVTASSVPGVYAFSGMLRDSDRVDHTVGGLSRVTVRAPQPVPPTQPVAPTPQPVNRPPVFRSVAAVSVAENTTTVVRVRATDSDSRDTVTGYAIRGGADSGKFSIVAATGELSFTTAPDFENPADAGANNEYVVAVRATSGAGGRARTATRTITVTVLNVDEMGTVTLSSTAPPQVGTAITASVTDPDGVVTGETWQWARSADGSTGWADTGATSAAYTPVQADEDNYLRATASYTDGEGSGKSAEAVSDNAVPAVSAGVPGDTNNDGMIDKPEVIAAFRAYVADPSDKTEMIAIFRQYVADSVSSQ